MKKDEPILICSAGHIYNPNNISHVWWKGLRTIEGKCPEVMSYDRMTGTKRCNRKLKIYENTTGNN